MAEPAPVKAGLLGLCPRCGARTLFEGLATFAPRCRACGLDLSGFNVGDGPAAFLTLFVGALITGLAIALDLSVRPPLWLHVLIWVPVTAVAVVAALRAAKGVMLALEYRDKAGEGR
jgi:uncharacterized protein (DUF983 family)